MFKIAKLNGDERSLWMMLAACLDYDSYVKKDGRSIIIEETHRKWKKRKRCSCKCMKIVHALIQSSFKTHQTILGVVMGFI